MHSGKQIGHWTCIIQDINQAVGCAMASFKTKLNGKDYNAVMMTCNYAFTNLRGRSAYTPGPSTSNCTTKNPKYAGLCGVDNKFYLNGVQYP